MNKADITRILEGVELTDTQVKALLDINSADITKALNKQKADSDETSSALEQARETIRQLEAAKGDTEAMQRQIDEYKAADEARKAAEKAATEKAELKERMEAVLDGRKFIHERISDLLIDDFGAAIKDRANRGKSDKDIFEEMTRDKGYFASQNPGGNGGTENMANIGNVGKMSIASREDFFKLSYNDQMQYRQQHPVEFKQMFGKTE